MRNNEAVQFVFEGAIRSDNFVGFTMHRPVRLDMHLTLGPCQEDRSSLSLPANDPLAEAFDATARRTPQDYVVHDVHRIGGDRR